MLYHICNPNILNESHFFFIVFGLIPSLVSSQKEDHQWIFNAWRIDDCSQSVFPEFCNASILDFNVDPPAFFRAQEATLDMDYTHAALCDDAGQLMLYSNGMSRHGAAHLPITNGVTH